ncbi:LapA family protein [Conexibacter sp. CPCC 206217]|uniref:LapA family protein n=1 Tax=Conexibacter sp. CPCC 206217 TaxID=3064574 RepID=UPI00271DBD3A|nr:LapA family protein [Conexibacter sp. CPCC 206217]MDO8211339.1 LapA family protein [Conexibacter sp. CPCC 206217]
MASPSQDPDATGSARSNRDRARLIAIAILGIAAAIFALANLKQVKVNFIIGTAKLPLIVVIVLCLLIGVAIGALLSRRGAKGGRKD